MELTIKIISVVLVFGVINLVLWGAQELYYREDTKKIEEIEAYLESKKQLIGALETKIISEEADLNHRKDQLDRCRCG